MATFLPRARKSLGRRCVHRKSVGCTQDAWFTDSFALCPAAFWRYAASALSSIPEKSPCSHSLPRSFVRLTTRTALPPCRPASGRCSARRVSARLPDGFLPSRPRTFRAVVLILLDGFGWRFFEKVADDYPALRRFAAASGVAKLTSQFPSTTAAHVTCLHTVWRSGRAVCTSGKTLCHAHVKPDASPDT